MDPKKMSNDTLALSVELWTLTNDNLTDVQKQFFAEVIWRLKLMSDVERENHGRK